MNNLSNLQTNNNAKWQEACEKYLSIKEYAIEKWFKELSDKEKEKIVQQLNLSGIDELNNKYKKVAESFFINWNNPGDPHSALFKRLLDGKKALINPPPTFFSYPWYDCIESNEYLDCIFIDDVNDKSKNISIGQSQWKILEKQSDTELTVTHHTWENLGFKWNLSLRDIPLSKAKTVLYGALTSKPLYTYQDIYDDALAFYNHEKRLYLSQENPEEQEMIREKFYNQHQQFSEHFFKTALNNAINAANIRIQSGKEPILEGQELENEIQKYIKNRLGTDFYLVDNEIYIRQWMIKRTFPEAIDNSYYLDV